MAEQGTIHARKTARGPKLIMSQLTVLMAAMLPRVIPPHTYEMRSGPHSGFSWILSE
jgi:hypothetical protein